MAKKRGKNRRPAGGVKIGGGPIAGMLIAKFQEYQAPLAIEFDLGIIAQDGSFTIVPAKTAQTENNPTWAKITDALGTVPINSASYATNGRIILSLDRGVDGTDKGHVSLAPSVALLEQYPGIIFAGGAARFVP